MESNPFTAFLNAMAKFKSSTGKSAKEIIDQEKMLNETVPLKKSRVVIKNEVLVNEDQMDQFLLYLKFQLQNKLKREGIIEIEYDQHFTGEEKKHHTRTYYKINV